MLFFFRRAPAADDHNKDRPPGRGGGTSPSTHNNSPAHRPPGGGEGGTSSRSMALSTSCALCRFRCANVRAGCLPNTGGGKPEQLRTVGSVGEDQRKDGEKGKFSFGRRVSPRQFLTGNKWTPK